ncbi:cell division protein CrgA [Angustibacter aerolatus]|uniref:Cell division protein CrgA n=1 Tax=Angustibacter aerolatus TaxID=1162965 RepID=A0ABQ6JFR6_9ACTN|nr:cell division protein CrgA [Angustibacter aerolatus]GMA87041.1 cell division protein CrgA [Angustibacter aerolatus]
MPESRTRKQGDFTPPPRKAKAAPSSPPWYAPVMVTLLVLGLAYIVVFYASNQEYPVPGIGAWNVVIGFGVIMAGFIMATRWR